MLDCRDFDELPKVEDIRFIARHKESGETIEFSFSQLYGYESYDGAGIFLHGTPNWQISFNSGFACDMGLNPDLDIRVKAYTGKRG